MNFYLCYVKNKKKFNKYIKINRISNKYIIDISKIIDDEQIIMNCVDDIQYLKILIINKIHQARQKNKDIYYIPNFNKDIKMDNFINYKNVILNNTDNYNLLCFYNEFNDNEKIDIIDNLSYFDYSQILKDY